MAKGIKKINRKQRWILLGVLVFFVCQIVFSVALLPRPAKALLGAGDTSVTIGDIPRTITEKIAKVLKKAADVAFKNILKNYLNNLAYNTATKIVTGKPGQKPLWPENPTKLLKDAGDAAVGDILDSLASTGLGKSTCAGYSDVKCAVNNDCEKVQMKCPAAVASQDCVSSVDKKNKCISLGCVPYDCKLNQSCPPDTWKTDKDIISGKSVLVVGAPECVAGFSLCTPISTTLGVNLPLKVQLQVLARKDVTGQTAPLYTSKCPLSSIIDNFESATTDWEPNLTSKQKSKLYLAEVSKTFNPESNQLGIYLSVINATEKERAAAEKAAEVAKTIEGPFDSIINPISKTVKTPGTLVQKLASELPVQALQPMFVQTGTRIADAIGTFTNTLAAKLIEKYLTKGLANSGSGGTRTVGSSPRGYSGLGQSSSGITAAKIQLADLKQTDYVVGGERDVLSSIASCPDESDPTPDTCVIDSRFSTAIEQQMTVQEALDAGLLDGAKIFGYNARGAEPAYYDGYPYRSLVILRKYRVIPVGWELAALYIRKISGGNYTLNSIIKDYDNASSPFYHLIDPNWVLKLPAVTCNRAGAGEKIDSEEKIQQEDTNGDGNVDKNDAATTIIQRQTDYCADEQSCIAENADGSCKKWGYCVQEKPIYKFSGNSCNSASASCMALASRTGNQVSYLMDTVNKNGCTSENVGCQNYCRDWDNASNRWTCTIAEPPSGGNQINLNRNASSCQATGEGCTELMSVANRGVNLLKNSDFESFVTTADNVTTMTDGIKDGPPYNPDLFPGWMAGKVQGGVPCGDQLAAVSSSFTGRTAVRIRSLASCAGAQLGGHWMMTSYPVNTGSATDGQSFTLSFYAKQSGDAVCNQSNGQLIVRLGRAKEFNGAYCDPDDVACQMDYTQTATISASGDWTRYVVTASFSDLPDSEWTGDFLRNTLYPMFQRPNGDGCDVLVDDIQLEKNNLTNYKTYEESAKTYLKLPPAYLKCSGNSATDDPKCANYALTCKATEVGCESYTSTTTSRVVTGTITNPNSCNPNDPASCSQCPAEFVGCQAYREMPIENMPSRPARDPISFVASTGKTCPATAVGCEEYTNLESVQNGGEGKEYYSQIRLCVNADAANVRPYYTWEGSDEFGYQLKKYTLKQSNVDGAPCTNMVSENAAFGANSWPNCVDNVNFDDNGDTVPESHPATSCVNTADTCILATHTCSATGATCSSNRDCIDSQLQKNLDCREFFDAQGNVFYREKTRVIFSSDQCKAYRNSNDGANVLYHMVANEGVTCQEQFVGCRAYKGNAGDNYRSIYNNDFESGSVTPWVGNAVYSNESTTVGGHSMLVANNAGYPNAATALGMSTDRSYSITFYAKSAAADEPVSVALSTNPALVFSGQAVVQAGDWNEFKLGPLYIPANTNLANVQLQFYANNAFFVDNIVLTEVNQSIYLIKDSYKTCSGYEGCDQYRDRASATHYLKSFVSLCSEDKVGCEAMIDTNNSTSPNAVQGGTLTDVTRGELTNDNSIDLADMTALGSYVYGGGFTLRNWDPADWNDDNMIDLRDYDAMLRYISFGGPAPANPVAQAGQVEVAPDNVINVVNDPKKNCAATDKGCEKMGLRTLEADGTIKGFTDSYIINNPDKYSSSICSSQEVGCEEYSSDTGSKFYFKDPGTNTCEYKKVTGQTTAGWYKTSTNAGAPDCPVTSGICSSNSVNAYQPCSTVQEYNICGAGAFCAIGTCSDQSTNAGKMCSTNADCLGGANALCNVTFPLTARPVGGWVGTCSASDSSCTEYRDPEEPVDTSVPETPKYCNPSLPDGVTLIDHANNEQFACQAYYYLSNSVDQTGCNGLVNREEGCRLFNDTSNSTLKYDSQQSPNGKEPVPCADPTTCSNDSNTVLKVIRDRTCGQWLDCSEYITQTTKDKGKELLCLQRELCDQLDPETGECIHPVRSDAVNQTYNTPAFVDQIKNKSGLVLAGLDWGRRCQNNENLTCAVDTDCDRCSNDVTRTCLNDGQCQNGGTCQTGNTCGTNQKIIEGQYPVTAMSEAGQIGYGGNIIENGDFGDSSYTQNLKLSTELSSLDAQTPPQPDGASFLPLGQLSSRWQPLGSLDINAIQWTEEDDNTGQIPSLNYNLDENNVAKIGTTRQWDGVSYNLGTSIISGESYVVSFKLRTQTQPTNLDLMRVQFDFQSSTGGHYYQDVSSSFPPKSQAGTTSAPQWEEYSFGPIDAAVRADGSHVAFTTAKLNFVQAGTGTTMTFFLDDVAVEPVLRANVDKRCRNGLAEDENKICTTDADCAPGICYDYTKITRSCRLYPRADSPYCTYKDETNTTYKGWEGYCLETDPKNPKYCINWWPVDLLRGEDSLFGSLPQYRYTGRTPVYMCLSTTGNYGVNQDPFSADPNGGSNNINGGGRYIWRQTNVSPNGAIDTSCDDWGYYWSFDGNTNGFVANNAVTIGMCCTDSSERMTRVPNKTIYIEDIEKVIIRVVYAHVWGGALAYPQPEMEFSAETVQNNQTYLGSGVQQITLRKQYGAGGRMAWIGASPICPGAPDTEPDKDCWEFEFWFVPENGTYKLENYSAIMNDQTGDHTEGVAFVYDFYLKDSCTEIAQVVDDNGDTKAWATRVLNGSTYTVPGLAYAYGQIASPFGALIEPDSGVCGTGGTVNRGDPATWDTDCNEPGKRPPYAQNSTADPTGGSTYSYTIAAVPAKSAGTMCQTITGHSKNGQRCDNGVADCCENYVAATGECADADFTGTPVCLGFNLPSGGAIDQGATGIAAARQKIRRLFATTIGSVGTWLLHDNAPVGVCVGGANNGSRCVYNEDCALPGYCSNILSYSASQATNNTEWVTPYSTMPICPATGRPAYDPVNNTDYCAVLPIVKNIAIGTGDTLDATKTSVTVQPGNKIQLSFDILVNPDQKPIRRVQVDWRGDGTDVFTLDGRYDSGTLVLTKAFTDRNASGYRPRIRVIDNWDWCGIKEGANTAGLDLRFYSDPAGDDCMDENPNPDVQYWIDSGKTIIVQ